MVELLNIDCMEYMSTCTDKQFDLAIVDPPYGIKIANNDRVSWTANKNIYTKYQIKTWDNEIPNEVYFDELLRVSKHQIIWGGNYFLNYINKPMSVIVWDKKQPEGVSFSMAEIALTSIKQRTLIFRKLHDGNRVSNNSSLVVTKIHPTQKPIDLYKWLLKNYATTDMTIIDTHLGSGSSAIAAYDFGCDFVGCEIDKDYYDAMMKRYTTHTMQTTLF